MGPLFALACLWMGAASRTLIRDGLAEMRAGRLAQAEARFADAAREAPDSADAWLYLGVVRFRLQQFAGAEEALRRSIRLRPSRADAWKALGATYAARHQNRLAEEPFRKACDLDPKEEDACYYLGRNYYEMNRFEAAIAAFDRALPNEKKRWRVHNGRALALEGLGRNDEGERAYRAAIQEERGQARPDEHPRIDYGAFLYRQGRIDEALEQLRSPDARSFRNHFELGKVLFSMNRLDEAARALEKAITLDPNHSGARLLLAKVYYRQGRTADAERERQAGERLMAPAR